MYVNITVMILIFFICLYISLNICSYIHIFNYSCVAEQVSFFSSAARASRRRLTAVQLMRYGSILSQWAVEGSDLDVVAVICTSTDNEETRSALETAFLCLIYLQLV